ncbi:hypothetical protein DENSPDRAFT_788424 [Dentipellis sp. KUC8613]|nr:hypothetical protein DENSPDRAFT_788424 [Dentipellis sp. KUC8613]
MWSLPSAIEGAILLKSAIMYTSRPLEFHVVCDDTSEAYLSQRLALLTHPVHNITVRFYRPSWQSMVDRIDRDSTIKTNHLAGVPGLMKLFLHEIFPDQVTKAIYVDTDAFFLTDPVLLWNRFATMNDTVAISMPTHPDQAAPQWHDANKICSCIMLLNFERLRNMRLMDSVIYRDDDSGLFPPALSPPTFEALFGPTDSEGHFENGGLGDQEYFWAIVKGRPDIFEHLPYDWEVSSCLLDMYGTRIGQDDATMDEERAHMVHVYQTPHEHQVILPKLVHFNCLFGVDVYFEWDGWYDPENTLTANWGSALDYHVGIKWIWLNRGHGKVDVATIMDPLFSDQRFARWREQTAST